MLTHLRYVRARLGAGAPTSPELAASRARALAALDDYIANGETPQNVHLPWRNPVFIDDQGRICAVGYLIERTAGRALADKIAAEHRYDFIEDIAASMPEVADWVASSGLSLDEVASIQPGYERPIVETWHPWEIAKEHVPDGPVDRTGEDGELRGTLRDGRMEGFWTRLDADKRVVGSGTLRAGSGTWTSFYPDGARMAQGELRGNVPEGAWRFFHPSGNLAAEGGFHEGYRDGAWRFFYDEPRHTPIASGSFVAGRVSGVWRHLDASGKLLAVSSGATPPSWEGSYTAGGYLLDVVPGRDQVRHWIHQGDLDGDHLRLDMLQAEGERLYVRLDSDDVYDASVHKLARSDKGWLSSACRWPASRAHAAMAGDVVTLDARDFGRGDCGAERPVSAARSKRLDRMLASLHAVRSTSPEFVRRLALGGGLVDEGSGAERLADTAKILASNMTWYVEWPHVDGQFIAVFQTLPGYSKAEL